MKKTFNIRKPLSTTCFFVQPSTACRTRSRLKRSARGSSYPPSRTKYGQHDPHSSLPLLHLRVDAEDTFDTPGQGKTFHHGGVRHSGRQRLFHDTDRHCPRLRSTVRPDPDPLPGCRPCRFCCAGVREVVTVHYDTHLRLGVVEYRRSRSASSKPILHQSSRVVVLPS